MTLFLHIGKKTYKGRDKAGEARFTKLQMRAIIKAVLKQGGKWEIKTRGRFNAQIDGWEYIDEEWQEADDKVIEWVLDQLKGKYEYYICFNFGERDIFGNKLQKGIFDLYCTTQHYLLRPKGLPISWEVKE